MRKYTTIGKIERSVSKIFCDGCELEAVPHDGGPGVIDWTDGSTTVCWMTKGNELNPEEIDEVIICPNCFKKVQDLFGLTKISTF